MRTDAIVALVTSANPVRDSEVRRLVPQEWSDEVLSSIVREPVAPGPARPRPATRTRLVVVAALALALLAVPTYAIGRAVADGWLTGEPAPESVVENFDSYAPQLGFRPDSRKAVLVARDGAVNLYATPNDRGSYCVATRTPDGGICVAPSVASAPLVAGLMSSWPAQKTLVGRVGHPAAVAVEFTDPDGSTVTRELGSSGFFVAALPADDPESSAPRYPCKNGDWAPEFRALSATGEELATAKITLARTRGGGVCQWTTGPHR